MTRESLWMGLAIACALASGQGCDDAGSTRKGVDEDFLTGRAAACFEAATEAGEARLCASCECGSCPDVADACLASGDASRDDTCGAAAECAHEHGCTGDECYCGTGLGAILCFLFPSGPCVAELDAAAGGSGLFAIAQARANADSALARAEALVACGAAQCATPCAPPDEVCTFEELSCQDRVCDFDAAREDERAASATAAATPVIDSIAVDGVEVWRAGDATRPVLRPGQLVAVRGTGFGAGVDVDFSKVMVGNSRVLETDLTMYEQRLDLLAQVNYEVPQPHSSWARDVVSWTDDQIEFRVPAHAHRGPLVVQVQKRLPANGSLLRPGEPHLVVDAQTSRIKDPAFAHACDVVSGLGPAQSASVDVDVDNPGYDDLVSLGRRVFWSYDYNIGVVHDIRGLDWTAILAGATTDPITGGPADPETLFGAYPAVRGQIPDEAIDDVYFDAYPQPNPVPGFLAIGPQRMEGWTRGSGYVGYRYAESAHPFKGDGSWIGFNCASCHGYPITYERAPGQQVTRVFPGLPNPRWSMKWALLGDFKGITGDEPGPRWSPGTAAVDKTALIYAMPPGAGEHNIVRLSGEGSHTDNDYQFSPIAIPSVTNYMPIRRSLSHTESYVGFEGSYIHSEEPDGALGSMTAEALRALTAYMTTLDKYDDDLRRVGMYRWLDAEGLLAGDAGAVSEGQFVQAGFDAYPALAARIDRGAAVFADRCGSCHDDGLGANTSEEMVRLDEVGRFFAPTIYQKEMQSIRATFLRDLYWVQHRGLLSDGHVRNLRDLVHPDRCAPGTPLYDAYYTLHPPADPGDPGPDFPAVAAGANRRGDVFRVPRAPSTSADDEGARRNRFIERHRYFVTVPWDPDHYYWDFQKLRATYGPAELGTAAPIGMPAAPHPWCASSPDEVTDLVAYLLTL